VQGVTQYNEPGVCISFEETAEELALNAGFAWFRRESAHRSEETCNRLRLHRKDTGDQVWELRLYVAGRTARSLQAFANLKLICEEHLAGRYDIEVVDLVRTHNSLS
jgi:hypothetical protein